MTIRGSTLGWLQLMEYRKLRSVRDTASLHLTCCQAQCGCSLVDTTQPFGCLATSGGSIREPVQHLPLARIW